MRRGNAIQKLGACGVLALWLAGAWAQADPNVAQTPGSEPGNEAGNEPLAPYSAPYTPPAQSWGQGLSSLLHLDAEALGVVGGRGARRPLAVAAVQAGLSLDTEQAGWWRQGQFDLMLMGLRASGNLPQRSGDAQLPTSLWAPDFLRVYQASYRQGTGSAFVQGGVMDLANQFNVTEVAGHLHNASFGSTPTLTENARLATFPNPGLAMVAGADLGRGWSAQAGLWQGNPPAGTGALRGALFMAEVARDFGGADGADGVDADDVARADDAAAGSKAGTTLKLGWWQHRLQGTAGASGPYGIVQHSWRDEARRLWSLFAQAGRAPQAASMVRSYLGAGARVRGLFAARPADVLTLGLAQVRQPLQRAETVWELVYSTELAPHVYVQPDLQYITRPGGGPGTQTVLGLRVHVEQ